MSNFFANKHIKITKKIFQKRFLIALQGNVENDSRMTLKIALKMQENISKFVLKF